MPERNCPATACSFSRCKFRNGLAEMCKEVGRRRPQEEYQNIGLKIRRPGVYVALDCIQLVTDRSWHRPARSRTHQAFNLRSKSSPQSLSSFDSPSVFPTAKSA